MSICLYDYKSITWTFEPSPAHQEWLTKAFWKHMAAGLAMDYVFVSPFERRHKLTDYVRRAVERGEPVYATSFEADELVRPVVKWMKAVKDSDEIMFAEILGMSFAEAQDRANAPEQS